MLSGSAFQYTDDTLADTAPLPFSNVGARLGGHLYVENDGMFVATDVAVTMGPLPIALHGGVDVDKEMAGWPVALRVGGAVDVGLLNYRGTGKADTTTIRVTGTVGLAKAL